MSGSHPKEPPSSPEIEPNYAGRVTSPPPPSNSTAASSYSSPPPLPFNARVPAFPQQQQQQQTPQQNYKVLPIPNYDDGSHQHLLAMDAESEEEIFQSVSRRESNLLWNRLVSYGISIALLAVVIIVLILWAVNTFDTGGGGGGGGDDDWIEPASCYLSPSCPAVIPSPAYDAQGWTNVTGWSRNDHFQCCNICPPIPPPPSTLSPPYYSSLSSSYGSSNNPLPSNIAYDYLVFDQIWLPQFCAALQQGHDPTLSHLQGSTCAEYIYTTPIPPRLTIHGIWPNRIEGLLSCCRDVETLEVPVLNPSSLQSWPFYEALMEEWFDPTTNKTYENVTLNNNNEVIDCSTCYLMNHEWQKHGSCFGAFSLLDENQQHYFESGLLLLELVKNQTEAINAMNGTIVLKADLEKLYDPYNVSVMCDPQDYSAKIGGGLGDETIGIFLEIQTCWQLDISNGTDTKLQHQSHHHYQHRRSHPSRSGSGIGPMTSGNYTFNFTRFDCPPPFNSDYSKECPEKVFIRNYLEPSSSVLLI